MKSILITGSDGFLGRATIKELATKNYKIFTVDLNEGGENHFRLDISNADLVSSMMSSVRPNAVIHMAAQIDVVRSIEDPVSDAMVNILGTLNLLRSASSYGVENFCYIQSGGAIYGSNYNLPLLERSEVNPISPYGISKLAGELYVKNFFGETGMSWSSLALSNCYGPLESNHKGVIYNMALSLMAGESPQIFGPKVTRDFVFVSDVVDAIVLSLETPTNCRVNISTGTETSLYDLYKLISSEMKIKKDPIISEAQPGQVLRSSLDNSLAKIKLGWSPQISLPEGLKQTLFGINS